MRLYQPTLTQESETRKLVLRSSSTPTTTAVGLLNSTINLDPSGAIGWSEISTYWDEFRVVGVSMKMFSLAPNSVTRVSDICMVVFDNDDNGALTSTTQAYSYTNKLVFPSIFTHVNGKGIPFSAVRPQNKTSPIPWIDVQNPSLSYGALKFFSESLDASTAILRCYIEYYVEVRGRR
jgi:hypothetical protein